VSASNRIKAADYRSKAKAASALAEASALTLVRQKHASAASAWTELAEAEERRAASLRRRFGPAAHAPSDNEDISCTA
jgi:hypothetical protein